MVVVGDFVAVVVAEHFGFADVAVTDHFEGGGDSGAAECRRSLALPPA